MARDKENYNKWFRDYYQKHKDQYIRKAAEYHAKQVAWFRARFKDIMICVQCGEKDERCLDFHHVDPSQKEETISVMMRRYGKDKIEAEVRKCIVLCANCHRKLHTPLSQ